MNYCHLKDIKSPPLLRKIHLQKFLSNLNHQIRRYNEQQQNLLALDDYFELYKLLVTINNYKTQLITLVGKHHYGFAVVFFRAASIIAAYPSLDLLSQSIKHEAYWLAQQFALLISPHPNHFYQSNLLAKFNLAQALLIFNSYHDIKKLFKLKIRLLNENNLLQHFNSYYRHELENFQLKFTDHYIRLKPIKMAETNNKSIVKSSAFSLY